MGLGPLFCGGSQKRRCVTPWFSVHKRTSNWAFLDGTTSSFLTGMDCSGAACAAVGQCCSESLNLDERLGLKTKQILCSTGPLISGEGKPGSDWLVF